MRRTPWFRALATLIAIWLPLIVGEPGVVHPCPMHGAHPPIATSERSAPQAHHAVSTRGRSDGGAPPSHDHHGCTCVGSCTSIAGAVPAPDAPTISVIEAGYAARPARPNAESLARQAPEYSRPYTTGPPRA